MTITFSDAVTVKQMEVLAQHLKNQGLNSCYIEGISSLPNTLGKHETFTLKLSVDSSEIQVQTCEEELRKTNQSLKQVLTEKLIEELDKKMATIHLQPIKITKNTDFIDDSIISQGVIRAYPDWDYTHSAITTTIPVTEVRNGFLTGTAGTIKLYPGPRPEIGVTYDYPYSGTTTTTPSTTRIPLTPEYLKDLIEIEKNSIRKDLLKDNTFDREEVQKFIQEYGHLANARPPLEALEELPKSEKKQPPKPSPQLELF